MKRIIRAAARDLSPRPSQRQTKAQREKTFIETVQEGIDIANRSMPSNHQMKLSITSRYIDIDNAYTDLDSFYLPSTGITESDSAQAIAKKIAKIVQSTLKTGKLVYKEDAQSFMARYSDVLEEIESIINSVASQYDSNMTYRPRYDKIISSLVEFNLFYVSSVDAPQSHVLGMKVTQDYHGDYDYVYQDRKINGPLGFYYDGNSIRIRADRPDEGLDQLEQGLQEYFKEVKEAKEFVDSLPQFEDDVDDFCAKFYDAYYDKYDDLSIEGKVELEYIEPCATITVKCYQDQIAFALEFSYDEWYSTDVAKKIINAIKYRKRRDAVR